jgi:hypothetical protein
MSVEFRWPAACSPITTGMILPSSAADKYWSMAHDEEYTECMGVEEFLQLIPSHLRV